MIAEAQRHAAEDRRRREEVDARNHADTVAYQVERQLHELGDQAPTHEKALAEQLISEIRQLVKEQSTDLERLRQLASDLQQLAAGLAATGYAHAASGADRGGRRPESPEDVIDAEFRPRG